MYPYRIGAFFVQHIITFTLLFFSFLLNLCHDELGNFVLFWAFLFCVFFPQNLFHLFVLRGVASKSGLNVVDDI